MERGQAEALSEDHSLKEFCCDGEQHNLGMCNDLLLVKGSNMSNGEEKRSTQICVPGQRSWWDWARREAQA